MESVPAAYGRAVASHRDAVGHVEAARAELAARAAGDGTTAESTGAQLRLAARMQQLAAQLAPGWLGCRLDPSAADRPMGDDAATGRPMLVRVGDAVR